MRLRRAITTAAGLAAFLTAAIGAQTPGVTGRVVAVADGDTLTVLDASKQQHRIRLNGIDAPESGQPFSTVAKAHLSDLVFGRDVTVVGSKIDRYGRFVGTVIVGARNANLEQLRAGLAWYYREYAGDVAPENRLLYEAAEAEARAIKRGLWRDASPQAPWAWRGGEPAPVAAPRGLLSATPTAPAGRVIGNRNSNVYHVPGCRSYNDVAERNRVYFATEAEAQAAGFRKARNCGS
jgi:endonuclease YncB( thermonuclease family)